MVSRSMVLCIKELDVVWDGCRERPHEEKMSLKALIEGVGDDIMVNSKPNVGEIFTLAEVEPMVREMEDEW